MKKIIFILLVVSLVGIMFAQNTSGIANIDNFLAPVVNPANMAVENSSGLAYLGNFNDSTFTDDYKLYFNFKNLAYIYDYQGNRESHRIAFSEKMMRNLYIGHSLDWINSDYKDMTYGLSTLYRPTDYLSIALKGDKLFKTHIDGGFGVAIRPLALLKNDSDLVSRLAVTYDQSYIMDEMNKPTIGLATELVNGIELAGDYSLETETFGLNFGINFGNLKLGSTAELDEDNELSNGYTYLNISEKTFRKLPFLSNKRKYKEMPFNSQIIETESKFKLGIFELSFKEGKTVEQVKKELKKLASDKENSGILLKSGSFSASYANLLELKKAFLEYKATGREIIYYSDYISNMNYAFAAAVADKIYLNPAGGIDLKGFSANLPYYKELLDVLGVQVYNFRSHKFKTAGNSFSETEMTEGEKITYNALFDDFYDEFKSMIKNGRGEKISKSVEELIDNGPYSNAEIIEELGLIDGTLYEDEILNALKKNNPKNSITKKFSDEEVNYDWSEDKKFNVALIYAVGSIHMGKGQEGKSIGSKSLSKKIRNARKNKNVDGIILRVDSGGGSALASDIIAREIKLCNSGKNKKPVVVSMAGAAASGGYYISAFADKIIAEPTTVTGSIGVIGIVPNLTGLFEKIHINHSMLKRGKHADLYNTKREMTEEEKELITKSIETTYWRFIDVVAKGRNLDRNDVHKIAKGRVWTGKAAKEIGLVDELGGLDKAVEIMQDIADTKNEVNLIKFRSKDSGIRINLGSTAKIESMFNIPQSYFELSSKVNQFKKLSNERVLYYLSTDEIKNVK